MSETCHRHLGRFTRARMLGKPIAAQFSEACASVPWIAEMLTKVSAQLSCDVSKNSMGAHVLVRCFEESKKRSNKKITCRNHILPAKLNHDYDLLGVKLRGCGAENESGAECCPLCPDGVLTVLMYTLKKHSMRMLCSSMYHLRFSNRIAVRIGDIDVQL